MGFIRDHHGRLAIETRRESFVIHPGYGYDESHNVATNLVQVNGGLEVREDFARQWRGRPHPEFTYDSLDDMIAALTELRDERAEEADRRRVPARLPSSDEIECAAHAILHADHPEASGWSGKRADIKDHYRRLARAALEIRIEEEDVVRVDGDAACPDCHRKYGDHEAISGWPTFHRGCDGALLKL